MVPLRLQTVTEHIPHQDVPSSALGFLNHLRFTAMGCRSMRRTDLFEACALLHTDRHASRNAHAEALMRCLDEALNTRARLLSPGTAEMTFDERWLVELGRAIGRDDEASVSFLLQSRVPRDHHRLVRFLIGRISECFALT